MKPPKSILDPDFEYTPARAQDVRKTFRRIRKELEAQKLATSKVVRPIKEKHG